MNIGPSEATEILAALRDSRFDGPLNMRAAEVIERMCLDLRTLALFVSGATPDRNTQTDAEVERTEAVVEAVVRKWNGSVS